MRSAPEGKEPTTYGTGAPLLPNVLRDVPDGTVEAFVGHHGCRNILGQ